MLRINWCRPCAGTGWLFREDEADDPCPECDGEGEVDGLRQITVAERGSA